ncbi:ribonuclease P [Halobacteriales archaeon QS_8_69_26]|nr:MAG: ribonuclease P [Halobacteriales archaeon QS_8_69_26]
MPLPKHLRPRWRYLAVRIETWPDADPSRKGFQRAVWESARALLGDPGSADAVLEVLRYRFGGGTGEAVVRVRHGEVSRGRAALACVGSVDGHPIGVRVVGVSGTIRACEEKYLGETPGDPDHEDVVFGDGTRPAVVRGAAVDVRDGHAFAGATPIDLEDQ